MLRLKIKDHFVVDHKVSNAQKQTEGIFDLNGTKQIPTKMVLTRFFSKWLKKI